MTAPEDELVPGTKSSRRERYAALTDADRTAVDDLLAGTGCEPLFT